ncbi:MAG TPA: SDR family NAD(P)-dependent oxidoreductase [Gemmataceae bacterium]|jgi:short-subunit dehydrogenase|nr:SDR family NAD(P)-dependent oxidoreductase [Gemmataceae bacterium]
MEFTGKRVLITGAGHGLGRTLALEFAHAGADVIVTDVDVARVDAVVAELVALGRRASGYQLNVTNAEQVLSVRDQVHAAGGSIDVLVNNAGIVSGGQFLGVPLDRHLSTVAVNLSGLLTVTHVFLPGLIGRPEARLVNIASASAVLALPLATTYAATKWAVLGFSDSLREELRLAGHRHVRISTICPSYMATGLFDGARAPLFTRLLTPERVARVVLHATTRGREFVMLPWTARLLYATAGSLPRGLFVRLCRLLGVSQSMSQWRGHAPSDGKQSGA